MKIWKKNILDKEKSKSKCKGPEVGLNLSVRSLGLKLEHTSESPVGLIKAQIASPIPEVSVQSVWGGAEKCACLTWIKDHTLRTTKLEI